MKTFFLADSHFMHKNIIRYCARPFADVDEMNETLIENWNAKVGSNDEIFVLGDFAFCATQQNIIDFVGKLNGRKILVLGNHDRVYPTDWWLQKSGFDEVFRFPILFEECFVLSHEPIFLNSTSPYVNIYGHIHNNDMYRDVSPHGFCVSVERIGYAPIEFEEIKNRLAATRE